MTNRPPHARVTTGLTRCQRAALQATADGLTSRQAAQQVGRHHETVRDHLSAAYRALGARNAAHAVALALRAGYIRPPHPSTPRHADHPRQGEHPAVTPLSPSDTEFAQLYEGGMRVPELAIECDSTSQEVRQRLARLGIPLRDGPGHLTGRARARVRLLLHAAYTRGMSIRQLSHDTGRSFGAIHTLLTEAGTTFRTRGGDTRRYRRTP